MRCGVRSCSRRSSAPLLRIPGDARSLEHRSRTLSIPPAPATAARGRLLVLVVPERQHVTVLVAGEVDRATARQLRDRLVDSLFYRASTLVVDATDLTFCDLSGLDALVDAVETVERSGVHVTIQPSEQLTWLIATAERLRPTSGQPGRDPAGCPLPRPSRQTA